MLRALMARWQQKHRTVAYPRAAPTLPERFRGLPRIDAAKCVGDCRACIEACPTDALRRQENRGVGLDLGLCLFCGECAARCPQGAIAFSRDHRLASRTRGGLVLGGSSAGPTVEALERRSRTLFGRSLKLRQVSAGGCNACEADTNVLSTVVFDLGRFGIQFVASPRHADGLLITGPVTRNMRLALQKTYEAVPAPKLVIAVGSCAISGGPYAGHGEVHDGAESTVPVDLHVPGCPPHPITILDGLLRLLGRMEEGGR